MFTTIEKLQRKVSASYGVVLQYGDKVFVADIVYSGGFKAEIYEFVDDPDESGFDACECRLNLYSKADQRFEDNGHAIEWCIQQERKD